MACYMQLKCAFQKRTGGEAVGENDDKLRPLKGTDKATTELCTQ